MSADTPTGDAVAPAPEAAPDGAPQGNEPTAAHPVAHVPASDARVLAVLVVHDGEPWLARTLAALDAQDHAALDVVAVDNGSTDGSRQLLQEHLGADRVLIADRDLGFGAAVGMALDARGSDPAPYVLLLHDDVELAPDAVSWLAESLDQDPQLAIVGPKLREWEDPTRLQSVGWTVDLTGRADSGVDEGELDQGQRDVDRRALYVSTSAMLLRRTDFDQLNRFDRRYHLFRDDLDLCWRAWLSGRDVEVVPAAVGHHAAAAATYQRLGQTRFIGPRYFAERNTLATLLKNYGAARLLAVVPAFFLVGIAKVLGFLLTRRFSDAWQTVRAWLWNALHLLETLRLRREVQRTRRRTDGELRQLFGRIAPRIRAYAEAIGDWIAGGDVTPEARLAPGAGEPVPLVRRVLTALRTRPVLLVGGLVGVAVLAGAVTILAPGQLRGGELAPWPTDPSLFLADHAASWHTTTGLGTAQTPSPAQGLLGLLQTLLLGSAYLTSRLLLLGSLLAAWILALRATQRYSARKLTRVVAATAYVLSPPALAAFQSGQLSALIALAALPGLVAAAGTYVRRHTPPARAWRAAAGAALLGAIAASFEPVLLPAIAVAGLLLTAGALPRAPTSWRAPLAARITLAALGPWLLTAPWSLGVLASDGPLRGVARTEPVTSELWRWVLLVPDVAGMPGPLAGVGFLLAGVLGMLFGWSRQAPLVVLLWLTALGGAVGGWWVAAAGAPYWPALPLLLSAAAYAGLLAVAFARGRRTLGEHAFGWRQLASAATLAAVAVSLGAVATDLARGPSGTYLRDVPALPQFITATAQDHDPFAVLVLADVDGELRHEVVPGSGPTMAATGVPDDPLATAAVEGAVADLVAGRDVRAGDVLGRLGIRYLVIPDGAVTDRLDLAVRNQVGLEPQPVASGRVLAITAALPSAALLDPAGADALAETGALPEDGEPIPLPVRPGGVLDVELEGRDGVLVLAQAQLDGWEVTADGTALAARGDLPVPAFDVPEGTERLQVEHEGGMARTAALAWQALLALLVVSLALRPPGFARRRADDPELDDPDETARIVDVDEEVAT